MHTAISWRMTMNTVVFWDATALNLPEAYRRSILSCCLHHLDRWANRIGSKDGAISSSTLNDVTPQNASICSVSRLLSLSLSLNCKTFSTHSAVTLPDVAEISGRRRRHPQMFAVVCCLTPVGCRTEDTLLRGIGTHRFPVQKIAYCTSDIKRTTWALPNRGARRRTLSQFSWFHLDISRVVLHTVGNGYLVLGRD